MSQGADSKRALSLALCGLVGVVLMGVLAGTRSEEYVPVLAAVTPGPGSGDAGGALAARSYRELTRRPWGERGALWATELEALGPVPVGPPDPAAPAATPMQLRATALLERARHRAFEGAPPTIPHPVRQGSAAECLACHRDGMRLGDAVAPPMSHPPYASCTQCHVVEQPPLAEATVASAPAESTFVGLRTAAAPYRWATAPPQLPHPTHMRERCNTCHGAYGHAGLRSSHLERQSCTQCHAPAAEVEQHPAAEPAR